MWKHISCEFWHVIQAKALKWKLQSNAIQLLPPHCLAWGLAKHCRTWGEAFAMFEMTLLLIFFQKHI